MKFKFSQRETKKFLREAQTMIEYLLLLGATVVIVLLAFKGLLPVTRDYSNVYFNKVSAGIMGDQVSCFLGPDGNYYYKARTYNTNYP